MGVNNKLIKELKTIDLEASALENQSEKYKKDFINEIKSNMGKDIIEYGGRPEKVKLSRTVKFKRWLKKYLF